MIIAHTVMYLYNIYNLRDNLCGMIIISLS